MLVAYYLRPAVKDHEGEIKHASWGGACTFFQKGKGCELSYDDRPFQCRDLTPVRDGRKDCYSSLGIGGMKQYLAAQWIPFAIYIKRALRTLEKVS